MACKTRTRATEPDQPDMRYFALAVFALHSLAELAFGANAYLSGGFSSQSATELANQAPHIAASARFLGAALFSLGLLGVYVLLGPGVGSKTGRAVAALLFFFHAIGVIGVLITAAQNPGYFTQGLGPLVVHLILALGFAVVLLRHKSIAAPLVAQP